MIVEPYTGGTVTNHWAVYQADTTAKNYFGGHVGIGSSTPILLLDVLQAAATKVGIIRRGSQTGSSTLPMVYGTPYLSIGGAEYYTTGVLQTIGFGFNSGSYQPAEIGFITTSTDGYIMGDLVFSARGTTSNVIPSERMRITGAGLVGIGTPSPFHTLDIVAGGTIGSVDTGVPCFTFGASSISSNQPFTAPSYVAGSTAGVTQTSISAITSIATIGGIVTTLTGTSDKRLKKAVPFEDGLTAVLSITPVRYTWNAAGLEYTKLEDREYIGFIAQDVQSAIPEAITGTEGKEKYLSLDTRAIIAALVSAVKTLSIDNGNLEARLVRLEAFLNGTAGDFTGSLKLTGLNVQGSITGPYSVSLTAQANTIGGPTRKTRQKNQSIDQNRDQNRE
jgi:hypothetical protein